MKIYECVQGLAVVYQAPHQGAVPEDGVIVRVSESFDTNELVFVGFDSGGVKACAARDLTRRIPASWMEQ